MFSSDLCHVTKINKRNCSPCLTVLLQMIHNDMSKMKSLPYFPVTFHQKQLKNVRDMLKRCLDKRSCMSRSGAAAMKLPKCQFFDQMAFLRETTSNKHTESNLPIMIDPLGRTIFFLPFLI